MSSAAALGGWALLAVVLGAAPAHAATPPQTPGAQPTTSLDTALRSLRSRGLQLIWSSAIVPLEKRVVALPTSGDALADARALLAPLGLELRTAGVDLHVIVRAHARVGGNPSTPDGDGPGYPERGQPQSTELSEVVVATSRYRLERLDLLASTRLSDENLAGLPGRAEDALRIGARVPGLATDGLSAAAHVRGGDADQVLVLLDGFPLRQPFHVPGYLSLFSILDPAVVSRIDTWTGGFPASLGGRMSAVIDAQTTPAVAAPHYEWGLSSLNATVLAESPDAWGHGNLDALLTARVGTLGAMLRRFAPDAGSPASWDAYLRLQRPRHDDLQWALNGLFADDSLTLARRGGSVAAEVENRANYVWLRADRLGLGRGGSGELSAWLGYSAIDGVREGRLIEPRIGAGRVLDRRDVRAWDARVLWRALLRRDQQLELGVQWSAARTDYDYTGEVAFVPPIDAAFAERPPLPARLRFAPQQRQLHGFISWKSQVGSRLVSELGLRAGRDRGDGREARASVEPRAALRLAISARSDLRLAWGWFEQPQGVDELRVGEGIIRFDAPQRARHAILGFEHRADERWRVRIEAFDKLEIDPRPRFENLFDSLAIIPELAPDRVRVAADSAESRGLELSADFAADPWAVSLAVARSDVTEELNGRETPRRWDQTWAGHLGLRWQRGRWSASLGATLHTGWPTTRLAVNPADSTISVGPRNAQRLGNFIALDLRAARSWHWRDGELELSVEATNVTDRFNPCCSDLVAEPEGAGAASPVVLTNEVRSWLPLVPYVGVRWRN